MDLDESEDLSILNGPNSSALFSSDQLNNEEITDDRPIKRIRGPYRARKARIVRKHDPNHNLITEDMEENEIHKTLNRMPHCDLYGMFIYLSVISYHNLS